MPRSAPIDGFSLAYDRVGSGPPVVLLHGWPGTRRDFRALVPLLTDGAQVVTPDLRGFGEPGRRSSSPRPTSTDSSRSTPSRERSRASISWNATVTPLPGAGHFSPLEAPEAYATAIRGMMVP